MFGKSRYSSSQTYAPSKSSGWGNTIFYIVIAYVIYRSWAQISSWLPNSQEKQEKAKENEIKTYNFYNSPSWKPSRPVGFAAAVLTETQVDQYASDIKSCWGYFNDDEALLKGILRQIERVVDLWRVNQVYMAKYGEDIPTGIEYFMPEEIVNISEIISKMY